MPLSNLFISLPVASASAARPGRVSVSSVTKFSFPASTAAFTALTPSVSAALIAVTELALADSMLSSAVFCAADIALTPPSRALLMSATPASRTACTSLVPDSFAFSTDSTPTRCAFCTAATPSALVLSPTVCIASIASCVTLAECASNCSTVWSTDFLAFSTATLSSATCCADPAKLASNCPKSSRVPVYPFSTAAAYAVTAPRSVVIGLFSFIAFLPPNVRSLPI